MENKQCSIIRDLLPSYVENLTSQSTNETIEQHMLECKSCRDELAQMKKDIKLPSVDEPKDVSKKLLRRIKLAHSIIFYPILFFLLSAGSYILIYFHIEDGLPFVKVLPLVCVGFLSYVLIKNKWATALLTFLGIITFYHQIRNPFLMHTLFWFAGSSLFIALFGYATGSMLDYLRNKKYKLARQKYKIPAYIAAAIVFLAISIPTKSYGNLYEYAWTKAFFEEILREGVKNAARFNIPELDTGLTLTDIRFEDGYYKGTIADKEGKTYTVLSYNNGIGFHFISEYEYLHLKGSNSIEEDRVLSNILKASGLNMSATSSKSNENGIYLVDSAPYDPIVITEKYSIFAPHGEDTTITLYVNMSEYNAKTKEQFIGVIKQFRAVEQSLTLHFDKINFQSHYQSFDTETRRYAPGEMIQLDLSRAEYEAFDIKHITDLIQISDF